MIPESQIRDLWAAARRVPPSGHVPYAFESRVMSVVRDARTRESHGWAGTELWKAAVVSVALAIVTTGLDLSIEDPDVDLHIEDALELAILPLDDGETEL